MTEVESALNYVATCIADRPDGAAFLPIFERLEAEVAKMRSTESAIDRARRLSRGRAAAAAG